MWKENKGKILISSAVILLPALVGLLLWNRLPDTIATHFDENNVPDGWSGKPFAVLGIPAFLLALHFICLFIVFADPRRKNIGKKPLKIVFWICPFASLLGGVLTYAQVFQIQIDVGFICCLASGLLLLYLGNLLPKVKQNYTFGVKLPWTLNDEENWHRTHRVAGWCMVAAGILLMATSFLHNTLIMIGAILLAAFIPALYSYLFYKRKSKNQSR